MKYSILAIVIFCMLLTASAHATESSDAQKRFKKALYYSMAGSSLTGFLVIENKVDGEIYFHGKNIKKIVLGRVIVPASQWNDKPFEAAHWAPRGVCATSVNAIHVKDISLNEDGTETTRIISILPREMLTVDPKKHASYYDSSSSIYTSIHAGEVIFGGEYTPLLGFTVMSYGGDNKLDEIRLSYKIPVEFPLWVTFENRFGGMIKIKYPGVDEINAGLVYRPVYGVGRFTGTKYCGIGRIRAVHSGVIDISTSPDGEIGGFQIVPHFHADTSSVKNIRLLTQWMVIGPLDPTQKDYGMLTDLFVTIQPRFVELTSETVDNKISPMKSRFHVVTKFRGDDDWHNFPELTGRDDDALESLEAIRIYFPSCKSYYSVFVNNQNRGF
ncbi:hypothetical protein J7L05_08545 [bacterium]|nr:hypothetical protein [bacterium]